MDGIIQKVLKPFIDASQYGVVTFKEKDLWKLQQELIEEIKKSHNNGGCDITCGNTKECRFIEELIGDN
jgi:hypothetical protein